MVVVVAGGSGSPGRTEVATALAGALAGRGEPTVLVDLDDANPEVARRLGFAPAPNVVDAVAALGAGRPPTESRGRPAGCAPGTVGFDVVAGLPHPGDGAQFGDVPALLGALAEHWRYVVADTAAPPAALPGASAGAAAADRPALAALRAATHVVVVCRTDPLGVVRLLDWAAVAAGPVQGRPVTVALNRCLPDSYRRSRLAEQLAENLPVGLVGSEAFLPEDRRVTEMAWNARPVGNGRFARAVDALARQVAPAAPAPAARRPRGPGRTAPAGPRRHR